MTHEYWGYHLIIDMAGSEQSKTKVIDKEYLTAWVKDLVKLIDMVPYGEPQVVHFADDCTDKAGNTVIQLIETSNIMAHFIDNTGGSYIDVFSCKEFNPKDVEDHLNKWFEPKAVKTTFICRKEPV